MSKYSEEEIETICKDPLNISTISFLNSKSLIITIPVWIYHYKGDFFIFTDKESKKVHAIKEGRDQISLCIINKSQFPNPEPESVPYITVVGKGSIVTSKEIPDLDQIHLDLLKKYDPEYKEYWIKTLVERIRANPHSVWMVKIKPSQII